MSSTMPEAERVHPASSAIGLAPAERRQMMVRAIVASTIGTAIEWYDFFLYGIAAALVFPRIFFPQSDPYTGTLLSFSTYFVGFVARPLGGVIFGHVGDRLGRKVSMVATLLLMGAATVATGLVPAYDRIGMWGGVVLVVVRILQGIGLGGVWSGSILLAGEWVDRKHWGFAMSWPQFGGPAGLLLANGALGLAAVLTTDDQFFQWGWRVPFLASLVLVFVGLYIRVGILETPVFTQLQACGTVEKAPVIEILRRNWREVVLTALMRSGQMAPFYVFITYSLAYGTQVLGLNQGLLLNLVMLTAMASLVSTPCFGYLSDRIGRGKLITIGCLVMVFFPFLYFAMIDSGVIALVAMAIIMSEPVHDLQYAPQAAFIAETFPGSRRYSGTSLGYQLASITAGGPAPILALYLFETYKTSMAIAAYMSLSALVSLGALWALRRRVPAS
ncbi:MAG: MHS family MFS transporter [Acidobacteria bacterium]|nr:MHS family MFS transporter [Acidobacteriota bacterium]